MIHLRHFYDGYPLCWPQDREGEFEGSFEDSDVDCPDCLGFIREWES